MNRSIESKMARIANGLYAEIDNIRKKYLECGVNLSFAQASQIFFKSLKEDKILEFKLKKPKL